MLTTSHPADLPGWHWPQAQSLCKEVLVTSSFLCIRQCPPPLLVPSLLCPFQGQRLECFATGTDWRGSCRMQLHPQIALHQQAAAWHLELKLRVCVSSRSSQLAGVLACSCIKGQRACALLERSGMWWLGREGCLVLKGARHMQQDHMAALPCAASSKLVQQVPGARVTLEDAVAVASKWQGARTRMGQQGCKQLLRFL